MILLIIVVSFENSAVSNEIGKDSVLQACQTMEKCKQGKFLSVTELSSTADRSSGLAAIDMVCTGWPFLYVLST